MSYQVPNFCGVYFVSIPVGEPSWLPQVSLSTESKIFDTSSRTVLTQTFLNPSKTNGIEQAKYNFPLYESCAVVAFRCYVAERLIEGIVKEKNEAKAEYKAAVAKGQTAGLLEQFTPDVFRTSIGNIPAGSTVKIEIEYIMELKHDAEADGLRFTIPTSIAPRYGNAPDGLSTTIDGQPIQEVAETGGMKISVQITMPSNVQSVQSPSHPIAVHLGGHVENVSDDAFNAKLAIATLGQTSTELGRDFVLLVKCTDLASPRALLETHDTQPNSKALMVTLVPKFTLAPGSKPEIVFVVDRSGSMEGRIEPLKSALSVFLKSLPVGVRFNICSFGSSHFFLWETSRPYSAETLEEAQKHTDSMDAELGGTEILPPIQATVDRRLKDLPLEIMVLTDGEVWDTESLFQFIEETTSTGDVRLFSLGIGEDVSHSLVEGMARVGRGFAQIVSNEQEGIEGKVVRMLRGGLSAHIKNYRLEWEGRPTEEEAKLPTTKGDPTSSVPAAPSTSNIRRAVEGIKKKINLFDKKAETDAPIGITASQDEFQFDAPAVLQAPYKLPPLFPFSRTTVYVILPADVSTPASVWLRGTTPTGDELELEIPVQVLPENAHTLHQLAARKVLQELEEGNSYFHSGKFGIFKKEKPTTFEDCVTREGTRIAVEYGLASKWTSFIAVENHKDVQSHVEEVTPEPQPAAELAEGGPGSAQFLSLDILCADDVADEAIMESYASSPKPSPKSFSLFESAAPVPPPAPASVSQGSWAMRTFHTVKSKARRVQASGVPAPTMAAADSQPMQLLQSIAPSAGPIPLAGDIVAPTVPSGGARNRSGSLKYFDMEAEEDLSSDASLEEQLDRRIAAETPILPSAPDSQAAKPLSPSTPRERTKALIALQSFEGSFQLTEALASVLAVPLADLEVKLEEASLATLQADDAKKLWATLLAVNALEIQLKGEMEIWELVVEKARDWILGLELLGKAELDKLEALAKEVLGA